MREARARVLNGGLSCSAAAQEDSEFGVKKVHVVVDGETYVEFLQEVEEQGQGPAGGRGGAGELDPRVMPSRLLADRTANPQW